MHLGTSTKLINILKQEKKEYISPNVAVHKLKDSFFIFKTKVTGLHLLHFCLRERRTV
jgi:hypothetical protein